MTLVIYVSQSFLELTVVAPILTEFQSNILTDVKDTVRHLPTADEVVDKVRPILNDGQATERVSN